MGHGFGLYFPIGMKWVEEIGRRRGLDKVCGGGRGIAAGIQIPAQATLAIPHVRVAKRDAA